MAGGSESRINVAEAANRLLNISVNQNETRADIAALPPEEACSLIAVEYELQLLRIVATGWTISYTVEEERLRKTLSEAFWEGIRIYCSAVSAMTGPVLGKDCDYFSMIRQRVDQYVQAMSHFADAGDPARVIGPTFAALCGCGQSAAVISLGRRVFTRCLARAQRFLHEVDIDAP
ncbi:MAG: hypothetical protein K9L59_10450 [Desulfobacterales bacterium]|nr:hypothetical protein [Desulfobacterales bacterium]